MFYLPFFTGALIATYMVSRLFIFLGKKFSGKEHYVLANILSLAFAMLMYGFTSTVKFGSFINAAAMGFMLYALPQLIWLIYDYVRIRKVMKSEEKK